MRRKSEASRGSRFSLSLIFYYHRFPPYLLSHPIPSHQDYPFTSSSNVSPLREKRLAFTAKPEGVSLRSSSMRNLHFRSIFIATQLSAPKVFAKNRKLSISSSSKYWETPPVILHSMASLRLAFPARRSGLGYLEEPDPATRIHAQPYSQNLCTNSLSAFDPLVFDMITLASLAPMLPYSLIFMKSEAATVSEKIFLASSSSSDTSL